jgi:tagatose 1,6-diphosphate aldolase
MGVLVHLAYEKPFKFLNPGRLVDGPLRLVLVGRYPPDPVKKYSPFYEFEMRVQGKSGCAGTIRLRIDSARKLRYPGHIGYGVDKCFRGNRFSARSCILLFPLAKRHGLSAVWFTVDPHNIASIKTCEIIGARYIETVRVPQSHPMYDLGARYRRRYRKRL